MTSADPVVYDVTVPMTVPGSELARRPASRRPVILAADATLWMQAAPMHMASMPSPSAAAIVLLSIAAGEATVRVNSWMYWTMRPGGSGGGDGDGGGGGGVSGGE